MNKLKLCLRAEYFPVLLIGLMIATRYHHFGDFLHLPDASLAVFFFAGFYRKKALLGFLMVLAALIDYLAIANGTSAYCISPAYVFLIPTYAVMWFAGRNFARLQVMTWIQLAQSSAYLLIATSLAFLISNGSFYLLSDKIGDLTWLEYTARTAKYYPMYLGATLVYAVLGWTAVYVFKSLPEHKKQQDAAE
ncbi:MAG: hypothetical protein NTV43_08045 [Methylococcales bacterium]|nr:hypothetical protein [Methylococcales bacterium]